MRNIEYQLFFIALVLLSIENSQAFYQADYEIKDLQETELALFQKEAKYWKIYGSVSETKIITTLTENMTKAEFILGGPDPLKSRQNRIYFERIYKNLPTHNSVTFTGKIWYFGSWPEESKPRINIRLTSSSVVDDPQENTLSKINRQANTHLDRAGFDYVNAEEEHQKSILYLTIEMIVPAELEEQSFGFREITLHLGQVAIHPASNHLCYEGQGPYRFENQICPCPLGQALFSSECQSCAKNCANCFGVQPLECRSCSPGTHWHGDRCTICHPGCKSCTGPSQHECSSCNPGFYDYENGTCLQTCEFPFITQGDASHLICHRVCEPDKYLFGSTKKCVRKCQFPFITRVDENGILLCQSPCSNEWNFIYTNGSCASSCAPPLKVEEFFGGKFCTNPCPLTNGYLYLNGSCFDSCPLPFKIKSEPIANYCLNPCPAANLYFYRNGSCLFRCPPPLQAQVKFGVKYCQGPCDLMKEFILNDGSCSRECLLPLVKRPEPSIGTHCLSPCESKDHFLSQNGACLADCPKFFETRIEHGVKYCLSPCLVDQYFFLQNKTCLDACPYPLLKIGPEGGNLCQSPCSEANSFLYDDQSCYQGCPAPLRIEMGNFCRSPCPREHGYVNINGDCQENCEYPYKILQKGPYQICARDMSLGQTIQIERMKRIIRASKIFSENGGVLSSLINIGDPTSLLMPPLLSLFQGILDTKTVLPMKVQLVLNQEGKSIQNDLEESFKMLGIVCVICFLLFAIRIFFKPSNESKIDFLLRLELNILAPIIVGLNGKVVQYLLGFQWNKSPFRIVACLVVVLFTTIVGHKTFHARNMTERSQGERWRFIFEIYKPNRPFLLLYIIRMGSVSIVLGCFSEYPDVQAILMVLANFGMLFSLIYGSLIRKTICYIQHLIIEIGLLLYNILFMLLAVQGHQENVDIIGDLMTIVYLITCIKTAIVIVLKLLLYIFCFMQTSGGNQTGHIQLRELNQSEVEENGNSEQQSTAEIGTWEIDNDNNDGKYFIWQILILYFSL